MAHKHSNTFNHFVISLKQRYVSDFALVVWVHRPSSVSVFDNLGMRFNNQLSLSSKSHIVALNQWIGLIIKAK